ncbi:MAG: 4'-phosphopantetheinyl transferase family protein [Opitutaceae bacterium]
MTEKRLSEAVLVELQAFVPFGVSAHSELVSSHFPSVAEEVSHLGGAVQSRIDEFNTGRYCLRTALAERGLSEPVILPDAEGVPILPDCCLGSISHSRGLCVAVACSRSDCKYLGVDVEKTNRLSEAAAKRVVHTEEASWVGGNQKKASVLFSLKEAFYKAQFPAWRCCGNFHDLVLEVDEAFQTARVVTLSGAFPSKLCGESSALNFCYRFVGDYVVSLCWMPASQPLD